MTKTIEQSVAIPTVGDIWLSKAENEPVVITGLHRESDYEELSVSFSNLTSEAFAANLGYFLEHYSRR